MPGGDAATAGTCLAKTGCRAVPALLTCPPGLVTKTLVEVVTWGGNLLGKDVAVRGPLHYTQPFCTDTACRPGACCNHCRAKVVLSNHGGVSEFKGAADAILVKDADVNRVTCEGDESEICCVLGAVGSEVVAQGILHRAGLAAQSHSWSLWNSTLCAP